MLVRVRGSIGLDNQPNPFYERVTQGAIESDWFIQYPTTETQAVLEISVGRDCTEFSGCVFYRPINRFACACAYCKATLGIM